MKITAADSSAIGPFQASSQENSLRGIGSQTKSHPSVYWKSSNGSAIQDVAGREKTPRWRRLPEAALVCSVERGVRSCRTDMPNLKGSEKNLGDTPHSDFSDTTFFPIDQISFGGWVHLTHRNWEAKTLESCVDGEATPSQIYRNPEIPRVLRPVVPATTVCLIKAVSLS